MSRQRVFPAVVLVLVAAALLACDGGERPRPQPARLTPRAIEALNEALQAEFKTQQTLFTLLEDYGDAVGGLYDDSNRRAAELASLFRDYGVTPPRSRWNVTNIPILTGRDDIVAELRVDEEARRRLYLELLESVLSPDDLRWTWERLLRRIDEVRLPLIDALDTDELPVERPVNPDSAPL